VFLFSYFFDHCSFLGLQVFFLFEELKKSPPGKSIFNRMSVFARAETKNDSEQSPPGVGV